MEAQVKDLYSMGKRELLAFKNRIARIYGMQRISKEDFDSLDAKIDEVIALLEGLRARDEEFSDQVVA
jgi:hypothetical protein